MFLQVPDTHFPHIQAQGEIPVGQWSVAAFILSDLHSLNIEDGFGRLCTSHCHEMQSKPSLSVSELNASFSERNKNIADSCSSPGDELTSFLSAPPLGTNGHHLSFR